MSKKWINRRGCLPVLSLLLCLAPLGCREAPQAPRNIILITIDTLRADHLGIYGYERPTSPRIDEWFASGRVFERAYATEAKTAPSVASILSGRIPQDHGIRHFYQLAPDDLEMIPDLLPQAYQTAAFVSNAVLTNEAIGIGSRFEHYDDFVDQQEPHRRHFERNAERTTEVVLEWMRNGRDSSRPLFLWVHYIDPHGPYKAPEDWPVSFEPTAHRPVPKDQVPGYMREPGVTNAHDYVAGYDEEITYVDAHVGRLLDTLTQTLEMDQALLILTSDHGETMIEHEKWFGHAYNVYEAIIQVPLLVRGPGIAPGRVGQLASGIDVAPTILRFAGVATPSHWDGADLVSGTGLDDERVILSEARGVGQQWRAAIQGDRKVRVAVSGEDRKVSHATQYDLSWDPAEQRGAPVHPSAQALVELLRSRAASDPDPAGVRADYEAGSRLREGKVDPRLEARRLEALQALGYVE